MAQKLLEGIFNFNSYFNKPVIQIFILTSPEHHLQCKEVLESSSVVRVDSLTEATSFYTAGTQHRSEAKACQGQR